MLIHHNFWNNVLDLACQRKYLQESASLILGLLKPTANLLSRLWSVIS